jgi:hypothetical protein
MEAQSVRKVYHDHKKDDHDHDTILDIYSAHKTGPGKCLGLTFICLKVPVKQGKSKHKNRQLKEKNLQPPKYVPLTRGITVRNCQTVVGNKHE